MSITSELKNVKKLEAVGFNHKQAEVLAEVVEESHVDGQESLKEFISNGTLNLSNELKGYIAITQKDLLIKIFGIIVGTVGIAVTILKLFP